MPLVLKYFVLKPQAKSKHDLLARASQKAMLAYAEAMEYCDPSFANDLRAWAEDEWYWQELMEEGE